MKKEILDFLKYANITEQQFYGIEPVGGSLYLGSLTSIPDGFNLTVGYYLDLGSLTSIPDGFNPTVGGSLYLGSLNSIPDGFNMTVGGSLYLGSMTSIPYVFNPIVVYYLDLGSLTSIPDGFNKSSFEYQNTPSLKLLKWKKNGKEYIFCDSRFSEVVIVKGNIYKLKDVNKNNSYYLVSDGNGKFAHGETIKEAKEDLIYKISNRDKSEFEGIDVNQKHSFEKCIEMYRVITGACATGTRNFIESKEIKRKQLSVIEICTLTKGNYGSSEFAKFFNINQ